MPLQQSLHHDLHLWSARDHPSPEEKYSHVIHQVQIDSPILQLLSEATSKWSFTQRNYRKVEY